MLSRIHPSYKSSTAMCLVKQICFVVVLCVAYDGSAFKLYDAEPLLRGSEKINLTVKEIEDVLNLDPGGEYTTMKFQYEKDQYLGAYDNKEERCYDDHVRCVTTIMSASRPVCGADRAGNRSDFGSLCDLYLDNCVRGVDFWFVIDNGDCNRATTIFVYNFDKAATINPTLGYP